MENRKEVVLLLDHWYADQGGRKKILILIIDVLSNLFDEVHIFNIETFYRQGRPLPVVSPGTQVRNFTHVSDIVAGLLLVGEKGEGPGFSIGSEKAYSVIDIAHMFGCEIAMLPERKGNRMNSDIDTEKTRALGWAPEKNIEDHIKNFLSSFERT
jgi:nucleoside-diphosphate-sugar epimerase